MRLRDFRIEGSMSWIWILPLTVFGPLVALVLLNFAWEGSWIALAILVAAGLILFSK